MSLNNDERATLVNLYLEKAKSTLHDAYVTDVLPNLEMAELFIKEIERLVH